MTDQLSKATLHSHSPLQEEAINAILHEINAASHEYDGHYLHEGRKVLSLVNLYYALAWRDRYLQILGPLEDFIRSCRVFRIVEIDVDGDDVGVRQPVSAVRERSKIRLDDTAGSDLSLSNPSGEVSASGQGESSASPRSPRSCRLITVDAHEGTESKAAQFTADHASIRGPMAELVAILEREVDSKPRYSMLASQASSRVGWPAKYKPQLGKFLGAIKDATRNFSDCKDCSKVYVRDDLVPGKDIVGLKIGLPEARDIPVVQPIISRIQASASRPSALSITTPDFESDGVYAKDFFNIPLIPQEDRLERTYLATVQKTRSDIVYLVRKGILRDFLSYGEGQFDALEWLGDAILHLEISKLLFHFKGGLFGADGLTPRRINAEQRLTLAVIYDELNISPLLKKPPPSWGASANTLNGLWKCKGDIIEALIGELNQRLEDPSARGVPHGHEDQDRVINLIKKLAQHALDRGELMKSDHQRKEIKERANAPGGGGFKVYPADAAASSRYAEIEAHEEEQEHLSSATPLDAPRVVCTHFLEGRCLFGDKCWKIHDRNAAAAFDGGPGGAGSA